MEKILREMIESDGNHCISFKDFMETALYHPEKGYYRRPVTKIGSKGDFYTSSNIGDVLGKVLARWYMHLFTVHHIPMHIIEIGGGTGRIAEAVLQEWKEQFGAYGDLSYTMIEESPYHLELQQKRLSRFPNVSFFNSLDEISDIEGVVFSNELFDAFPVHAVENKRGLLHEIMVGWDNGFIEVPLPLGDRQVQSYLDERGIVLQDGWRIEIPLPGVSYYRRICKKLAHGVAVTIDYGYTDSELAEPAHREGSIRGYHKHRMVNNPLQYPGIMDLTSHIHWDSLIGAGERNGASTLSFLSQHEFLVSGGIMSLLAEPAGMDPFSEAFKRNRAIRSLLEPGEISLHFQVLVQGKGIGEGPLYPINCL